MTNETIFHLSQRNFIIMLRLIQFLIHGCFHEWEVINQVPGKNTVRVSGVYVGESKGTTYTLRCRKCGKMKVFEDF